MSEKSVTAPRPHPWRPHPIHFAVVGLGGLHGANARYHAGEWVAARWGTVFPWGTLLINVSGSLVLGFFLALMTERRKDRPALRLFVATGFLGGYTTFSTFGHETIRLIQDGDEIRAMLYIAVSVIAGTLAVIVGMTAARGLRGRTDG